VLLKKKKPRVCSSNINDMEIQTTTARARGSIQSNGSGTPAGSNVEELDPRIHVSLCNFYFLPRSIEIEISHPTNRTRQLVSPCGLYGESKCGLSSYQL